MSVSAASSRRRAAGATVAAGVATAIALTPVPTPQSATVEHAVQLVVDTDSILNIPANLFQALLNIPATNVAAMNLQASSLMFTGNWFTPSATNVWGEDTGDPGHFMAVMDILFPFKEISGLGAPEIDPVALADGTAGLGQQFAMLAAAWLPAAASCAAISCLPLVPMEPITGITAIDRMLAFLQVLGPGANFELFDNWFKVPLAQLLDGYTFPADLLNPSDGIGPNGSVPDDAVFGFPGTIVGPNGENLLPWSGLTFKMDLAAPFQNFYNSLLAPPESGGIDVVTFTDYLRALQAMIAGNIVSFNTVIMGSPTCPGSCAIADTFHLSTHDQVQNIANLWPGNPLIDHWLALDSQDLANGSTAEQIKAAIAGLQLGIFMFSPAATTQLNDALAEINPVLPKLLANAGITTDPAFTAWDGSTPVPDSEFGGHDPTLVWGDLVAMFTGGGSAAAAVPDVDPAAALDGLLGGL